MAGFFWPSTWKFGQSPAHRSTRGCFRSHFAGFPLRVYLCYGQVVLEQVGVLFHLFLFLPNADFSPNLYVICSRCKSFTFRTVHQQVIGKFLNGDHPKKDNMHRFSTNESIFYGFPHKENSLNLHKGHGSPQEMTSLSNMMALPLPLAVRSRVAVWFDLEVTGIQAHVSCSCA